MTLRTDTSPVKSKRKKAERKPYAPKPNDSNNVSPKKRKRGKRKSSESDKERNRTQNDVATCNIISDVVATMCAENVAKALQVENMEDGAQFQTTEPTEPTAIRVEEESALAPTEHSLNEANSEETDHYKSKKSKKKKKKSKKNKSDKEKVWFLLIYYMNILIATMTFLEREKIKKEKTKGKRSK